MRSPLGKIDITARWDDSPQEWQAMIRGQQAQVISEAVIELAAKRGVNACTALAGLLEIASLAVLGESENAFRRQVGAEYLDTIRNRGRAQEKQWR